MSRVWAALLGGFALGVIFANLSLAPAGRWVFMVPAAAINLFFAFVLPWLTAHYRIDRPDRARGGQA